MKPNKLLGQNFLTSKGVVHDICQAGEITKKDTILEVGPGKGFLTEEMVKLAGKVVAVEKDHNLVAFLREKFANTKNLEIIDGDILKIPLKIGPKYKIIANIPYYLTSHLIRIALEGSAPFKKQPQMMVLMVQKEVAERIMAKNGRESLLSISIKAYGEPKIVKKVPAGCFFPKPKVDSAIITIKNISKKRLGKVNEADFFIVAKQGFSHKRKTIKNNLGLSKIELEKCGVIENQRAENLKLEQWICLTNFIHKNKEK